MRYTLALRHGIIRICFIAFRSECLKMATANFFNVFWLHPVLVHIDLLECGQKILFQLKWKAKPC